MYPIILFLLVPAILSQVIEDINLPTMSEARVQCLFNKTDKDCPGSKFMLKFINKFESERTKTEVDSFITQLFLYYETEMKELLPKGHKSVTAVRNLWSAGGSRLFDRVFCGTSIGREYIIRAGYIWWPTVLSLSTTGHVTIQKSNNCDKEDHCAIVACEPGFTGIWNAFSFLHNTNPYIDLMVFTGAVYKGLSKAFSSHHLTYKLEGGFLNESSYVTVVYKNEAENYAPENVKMVYYSLMAGGPLEPTGACTIATER